MTITAPKRKIESIRKDIKKFCKRSASTPRQLASILGKINSLADAMFPVRVCTTGLQSLKNETMKKKKVWDCLIAHTPQATKEASWWLKNIRSMNGRSLLPPVIDQKAGTDASDHAWGAWIYDKEGNLLRFGGHFSKELAQEHINYKELLAVKYLIDSCPNLIKNKTVDIGIDNITALYYINRMGGRNTRLGYLASQIYATLKSLHATMHAHYIPTAENTIADEESRVVFRETDMQLNPQIFQMIDQRWGPHTIDMFATYQNRQIERFGALKPSPNQTWLDSMSHSWRNERGWVHPPFALIPRILRKVEQEQSTVTLIAPLWPAQPWFPLLFNLLVDFPLLLPEWSTLLLSPHHHKQPQWATVAWKISGRRCWQKEFRRELSITLSRCGQRKPTKAMRLIGSLGSHFAKNNHAMSLLLMKMRSMVGLAP